MFYFVGAEKYLRTVPNTHTRRYIHGLIDEYRPIDTTIRDTEDITSNLLLKTVEYWIFEPLRHSGVAYKDKYRNFSEIRTVIPISFKI